MAASGGALNGEAIPPIDVLTVVALEAVLDKRSGGDAAVGNLCDHVHMYTSSNYARMSPRYVEYLLRSCSRS
jgi:hypothetical protein